ncbi:hypothetical protein Tco_1203163 [Tanacetum coccineum]
MVTLPPSTGNFSIPWAVDGTARIAEIPGLPIMPLYGDGDLITINNSSGCRGVLLIANHNGNRSLPHGHLFFSREPVNDVVAGFNTPFNLQGAVFGCNVSYSMSQAPLNYMRWMSRPAAFSQW